MPPIRGESATHEHRLASLEEAVDEIKDAVKGINESMKELVKVSVLQTEHSTAMERAFSELKDITQLIGGIQNRVLVIETTLPKYEEMRGLLLKAVVGIIGAVGVAVLSLVILL